MSFWQNLGNSLGLGTIFGGRPDLNKVQNGTLNTVGKPIAKALSREQAVMNGDYSVLDSMDKGGPIKKTGSYKLHQGEEVLNKKKAMAYRMLKQNPGDEKGWRNLFQNVP